MPTTEPSRTCAIAVTDPGVEGVNERDQTSAEISVATHTITAPSSILRMCRLASISHSSTASLRDARYNVLNTQHMQYRILGRTGIRVSEIGFGAWAIGGTAEAS